MNFKEYEEKAITTKCYANEIAIPYVVLGLCGETGEFFEKIQSIENEKDVPLILKEVGDILWYVAAIRIELDLRPLFWPKVSIREINPITLVCAVGAVAEQTKKYLRDDWKIDDSIEFSEERKLIVHNKLQELLQCLADICEAKFNISLEEIAKENIEKLADRANRGCIHGSGDER